MNKNVHKQTRRSRRRIGIRKRIQGTNERPRLSIYKSLNHIYAQVIDDLAGKTIASASSRDKALGVPKTGNAQAAGVKQVVFDRGGFKYHGRVKALGEAARKAGLQF